MSNTPINRDLSNSLRDAFGGSPASSAPQQSAPVAPPSGGSAAGSSMWQALMNVFNSKKDPYQNAAQAITQDKYVR